MKPTQVSAAMQQHQYQANLRHTLPPHVGVERKQKRSGVANFTMSDCYEKLKQLVPTIPKNRKVTRVEILQHVIDYIQDLQTALEGHNINVKAVGNLSQVTGMLSSAFPAPAAPNRTPFTTLVPERDQNCAPMGMFSAHNQIQNQNQSQRQPPFCTQTSMFHHQGLHDFHHRQQMSMNTNMLASTTHPSHKLHPYDTPESSPESRPCSC